MRRVAFDEGDRDSPRPSRDRGADRLARAAGVGRFAAGQDAVGRDVRHRVEIAVDGYGVPPPGEERLVLGHESLGEVVEAPDGSGFEPGDLVVGVVRRPDAVPCPACAADEWDMCRNGGFVERGIKERHGYGSERFRVDPRFAVRLNPALGDLGVLLEPTSVLAKAWRTPNAWVRAGGSSRGWR